jgi:hypothetical protein
MLPYYEGSRFDGFGSDIDVQQGCHLAIIQIAAVFQKNL